MSGRKGLAQIAMAIKQDLSKFLYKSQWAAAAHKHAGPRHEPAGFSFDKKVLDPRHYHRSLEGVQRPKIPPGGMGSHFRRTGTTT